MDSMSSRSIAIVTGASKGIGKAIAVELAHVERTVVCVSKSDQQGLLDTVDIIKSRGHSAYPILCDVSDYENVRLLFEEIKLLNLPVEILVNNAGISLVKLFTETTPSDWHHLMATNLTSVYNMCHHTVPQMVNRQKGQIINISSIWGNDGASMEVAYSTTKGGINSFTKAWQRNSDPATFMSTPSPAVLSTPE